jgi:quercetin dioxygenase-like cupin family protein
MEVLRGNGTTKGPAEWFTGDVYIDPIAQGQGPTPMTVGSVHFTPCARTHWHVHSIGQTLFVTEGEGRMQGRGGPVHTIRPGDIVRTPGGEWHWHGAAPDKFMSHLRNHRRKYGLGGPGHRCGVPRRKVVTHRCYPH